MATDTISTTVTGKSYTTNTDITVLSGGVLSSANIYSGGSITVLSGGSVIDTTVSAFQEVLYEGASAQHQTVTGNGQIVVGSGVTLTQMDSSNGSWKTMSGGSIYLVSGATLVGGTFISGGTLYAGDGSIISGFIGVGNGGVLSSFGQSGGTIDGQLYLDSGGIVSGTVLASGASEDILSGASVSGQIINGSANVSGTLSGATVSSEGNVSVVSGGIANGNTITDHGSQTVLNGGIANGNILSNGGGLHLSSGGLASDTVVSNGGALEVNNSGSATNTTVNSGGYIAINTGGNATGNTVNSGGVLEAAVGGIIGTTTVSSGGTLFTLSGATISGDVTLQDGGSATIWNNTGGTINLAGDTNNGLTISGLESGGIVSTIISGWTGNGPTDSDKIDLAGVSAAGASYALTQNQVVITLANGNAITLNIPDVLNYGFTLVDDNNGGATAEVCFLAGSMIQTPGGDVPVENIRMGDTVLAYVQGVAQPTTVTWTGKAHVVVRPHLQDDEAGYPVRILKDAISDGVPYKDMLITSEHCLFFDGKFVPARMLVNGFSIFYDKSITSYDYYHVETEQHFVIQVDGMLTESYLDTGNRRSFRQEGSVATLASKFLTWEHDAGAPLCVDRSFVEPLFRKLESRENVVVGYQIPTVSTEQTNDPALHLLTHTGAVIRPMRSNGQQYSFMLPPGTKSVRIVSRASRPADVIGPFVDDRRYLGVAVTKIYLLSAKNQYDITAHLQAEKPEGWHATDWTDCAWTNGNAELPLGEDLLDCKMGILSITVRAAGPYLVHAEEMTNLDKVSA
ncbi:Hint domain-containing protein [Acetobacter pasteurianus]|uniref:Hint domain-containing protein n=1 Tax=Acetobacter pasteurianus TaxID=438 RepID=UPI000FFDF3CA|nr:Hint domain-containing protein [Acetobacter pasteurianus]GCD49892.1 outer membrane protein [Acetobacter pasteurianus subsp. pasteurianus LMG 1262 = NBRC 106471]